MGRRNRDLRGDDVIDSRDVIKRLDELESDLADRESDLADRESDLADRESDLAAEAALEAAKEARDAAKEARDAAKEALEAFKTDQQDELVALRALVAEASQCTDDWEHGATLIRERHFVKYAEQLADDIGAIDLNHKWPLNHIDWEAAAEELQGDYCEVDFDGETYFVR